MTKQEIESQIEVVTTVQDLVVRLCNPPSHMTARVVINDGDTERLLPLDALVYDAQRNIMTIDLTMGDWPVL